MTPARISPAAAADYAAWFRLLADPARVQIVSVLARAGGPVTVPQLARALPASRPALTRQLRVLAAGGLVQAEQHGPGRRYRLSPAAAQVFPRASDVTAGRLPPGPPAGAGAAGAGAAGAGAAGAGAAGAGAAGAGRDAAARPVLVRAMRRADAPGVLAIYQAGLDAGQASFETQAPSWAGFDAARLPAHRLVATDDRGRLLGWAAVSAVSGRAVYAGVVEHSLYVSPAAHRSGVGLALLSALIASTEAAGIWTIQSGIFPENEASLRLHRRAGFRVVGTRERIGRHHGRWRDVVLVERRRPDR